MEKTPRDKLLQRWGALKSERSSWVSHWRELSDYLLPRSGRFLASDRNRGEKRHNTIYDSTGTRALRTLAAGMMAGMTSPARPWFRLTTADPDLAAYQPVKEWLADVTALMLRIFERSNTYRTLHGLYEELGAFGTGASIVLPDYRNVLHHYPLTIGGYAIAADHRGQVSTIYREEDLTVGQMVGQFGLEACSHTVRNLYSSGSLDAWVPVMHAIEPRADRDPSKRDAKNMAWRSTYFEPGGDGTKLLRESGFKEFPALVPRWATAGGDIYGSSPGMEALGDVKQLQHEQLRKAQGIDYKTKPPLQVPTGMKGRELDLLPGGVTFVDAANAQAGARPMWEVNLDLSHLLEDIRDVRDRINGCFYADLFLMIAQASDTTQRTAAEIAERHEEKLLMLGPVLERLHNELLDPFIEAAFSRMVEAGIVPPPPQEMQGQDLNVDFVSMLAQAQRAVGTNAVDRYVGSLGAVAQFKPDVLDKLDSDRWADEYADMLGVDPRLIVPSDKVALIRQERAQQAQQAQQAALMNQGADTAQKLANARTSEPSALTNVMGMFSGYSTP